MTLPGGKTLKTLLLLAFFDLPAQAVALKFSQFNGKYGCSYCLDKESYIEHRRLYLPDDVHTPQSIENTMLWADEAEEIKKPVFCMVDQFYQIISISLNCAGGLYACRFGRN